MATANEADDVAEQSSGDDNQGDIEAKPRHNIGNFNVPDDGVSGWNQWGYSLMPVAV